MDRAVWVIIVAMDFAERLRYARKASGLTQQQVADACGVSNRTVSSWENGVADGMLADNLFSAADAMGVNPRWLATGQGPMVLPLDPAADLSSDLRDLPAEKLDVLRALVKSLK